MLFSTLIEIIVLIFSFVLDHQRFDQPSFASCAKMESLLVKALNSQDNFIELQFIEKNLC